MASEKERMKEALLSGVEPTGALRERFEKQAETLTMEPLSPDDKAGRIVQAVALGAGGIGIAYFAGIYVMREHQGVSLASRVIFGAVCAAMSAVFIWVAYSRIGHMKRQVPMPRRQQRILVFSVLAFALAITVITLLTAPGRGLSTERLILTVAHMFVLWSAAILFALHSQAQWHREDILLEQKRTQLEVAMLREMLGHKGDT